MTVTPDADPTDTRRTGYRRRLMDGMAEALAASPYRDVTIGDVVKRAHTSRRTFYEEFRDRDDCYFALLRSVHSVMLAEVAAAVDPRSGWEKQIRQAVTAYFTAVAAHPAVIRSWVRELPSLGDPAVTLASRPRDEFINLLVGLSATDEMRTAGFHPLSVDTARFLVGGVEEMTALVVEDNRPVAEIVEVAVEAVTAVVGLARTQTADA